MLDSIIGLLQLAKTVIYSTLLLSWSIGHLIVIGIQTAWSPIVRLITASTTGVVVLLEDFSIFIRDLFSQIGNLLIWIAEGIENFAEGFNNVVNFIRNAHTNVWSLLTGGTEEIVLAVGKIWSGFVSLLHLIKNFIILFGSGVWFAVTFIPLSGFYLLMSIFYLSINTVKEAVNFVFLFMYNLFWLGIDLCNFIIDVPVESIIGLAIGGCIGYVIFKTHAMLYVALSGWVKKVMKRIKKKLTKPPISSPPGKNGSCIICFERNRCLVTMPCRHLCMCERCWERLESIRSVDEQKCPVCRARVQYTIHVY